VDGLARDRYHVPRRRESVHGACEAKLPVLHAPSRYIGLSLEGSCATYEIGSWEVARRRNHHGELDADELAAFVQAVGPPLI